MMGKSVGSREKADLMLTQAVLTDPKVGPVAKYRRLVTGGGSIFALIKYELITGLFGWMPGLVGLALRQVFYRFLFKRMGKGVAIGRNVTLRHPGRIQLGSGVVIEDDAVLDAKGEQGEGIILGDEVFIGRNTILTSRHGTLSIGRGCNVSGFCRIVSARLGEKVLIAAYVYIIGGGHESSRVDIPPIDQPVTFKGGAEIGDGVWLGAFTAVMDGVKIGRHTIVGTQSLVSRDLPEYTVAFGSPAEVRRNRKEEVGSP